MQCTLDYTLHPPTQPLVELSAPRHATTPTLQDEVAPVQLPIKNPDIVATSQRIGPQEGALVARLQKLPIQTAHLLLIRKNVWSQMQVYSCVRAEADAQAREQRFRRLHLYYVTGVRVPDGHPDYLTVGPCAHTPPRWVPTWGSLRSRQ